MTTVDAIVNGGAVAVAIGLVRVIEVMARRINGNKSDRCLRSILSHQEITAAAVGKMANDVEKMADHVNALTTSVAVIDTKITGLGCQTGPHSV